MNEKTQLIAWINGCKASFDRRMKALNEGVKKVKQERQEQTGKPYQKE